MRKPNDFYAMTISSHSRLEDLTDDTHPQYRWPAFIPVTGRWFWGSLTRARNVNITLSANTIYAMPFQVRETTTFDRIGCNIQTASAGLFSMGIYDSLNGFPNNLVTNTAQVSSGSTGNKTQTISQTLSSGLYFLCVWSDATPILWGLASASATEYYGSTGLAALGANGLTYSNVFDATWPAALSSPTYAAINLCVRVRVQ